MSNPNPSGSGFPGVHLRCSILIAALFLAPFAAMRGQEHDDDHEHGHLHFSHPLVTESPSPDTKLRFDYLGSRSRDPVGLDENIFRFEGEYAFTHNISLAIVAPFISRIAPATERASALGNVELSLKAASLAFGERGLLLGGGLSAELPTGSDAKGIGSSHLVELEPFVDAGYKRDELELVAFMTLSSTFRRRTGEEAEHNLAMDFSALYAVQPRIEALIEITTERALIGEESGSQETFVAPGLKVYPFTNRRLMFGASVAFGTGAVRNTRAVLLSGFYHF